MEAKSTRSARNLRAVARVAPALVALAILAVALATTAGCGNNRFGFGDFSTPAPTSSVSPGMGAFLYAANYNDGRIAEFARNTSTGALTLKGTVTAGASQGPRGLAVDPSNSYLYVANYADGYVYEFSINGDGTLTGISKIAAGTHPEVVAISPNGRYVYVTNLGNGSNGSISEYSIGSSGALVSIDTVSGIAGPLGIAIAPNGSFAYVADNLGGVIWSYVVNSNGTLAQNGPATPSLGTSQGSPALDAVASDSSGEYLFATDVASGAVSEFTITLTGAIVFGAPFPTGSPSGQPFGIGLGFNTSSFYLFTANSTGGSISAFARTASSLTLLTLVPGFNGPTGLAVDPQGEYVYTGDSGDGTVGQMQINGSCGQSLCAAGAFNTENPANSNAGTGFVTMTN